MTNKKSGIVALFGKTNVGKSTLLNAIIGEMVSIVTYKPQTTRSVIKGILNDERGQIVFLDTPGLHKPFGNLGKRLNSVAYESIYDVDLLVVIVDSTKPISFDEKTLKILRNDKTPKLILLNKVDLIKDKRLLLPEIEHLSSIFKDCEILPISALKEDDVKMVKDKIFDLLKEGEPLYDEEIYTDQMERQIAGEIVRKNLFLLFKEEIPYSTAVYVEEFKEPSKEKEKLFISAVIVVAKESQKPIILGRGGKAIKELGIKSRVELEEFFQRRINLNLFVKVKPDWENDPSFLKEMGI